MKNICLHGHFYQPSRIDPWTGRLDPQPSASPYADWNHRINDECYTVNAAARLLDGQGKTRAIRNNYAHVNFDIGPTLLHWFAQYAPEMITSLIEADTLSRDIYGQGSAIAQPYHHTILPLATAREKALEVRWGLDVFRKVFGRDSEGMWLPETAVDTPTLEVAAEAGLKFVIVAGRQIAEVRAQGETEWTPTGGDGFQGSAVRINLPSGKDIIAIPYHHELSSGVAFGGLLHDGGHMARTLAASAKDGEMLCVATDGETFGHHHAKGEMAVAYASEQIEAMPETSLINIASWLDSHDVTTEGRIVENSSWSCAHGVDRWYSNCGCAMAPQADTHQEWRGPLREALNFLRDETLPQLETFGSTLFSDPEASLADFGGIIGASEAEISDWLTSRIADNADPVQARHWLECHRNLLAMYTSCAWFFDHATGIEVHQNLRHAGCAIGRLAQLGGSNLSEPFIERIARLPANGNTEGLCETVQTAISPREVPQHPPRTLNSEAKKAGFSIPLSALPGEGPIGDLDAAIQWIDWAKEAGGSVWAFDSLSLPTIGRGRSASALSGDPLYIGLDWLHSQGLLDNEDHLSGVTQEEAAEEKLSLICRAAQALLENASHPMAVALSRFLADETWALEAARFDTLKSVYEHAPWWTWPEADGHRSPARLAEIDQEFGENIKIWQTALFLFETQWREIRRYADAQGVTLTVRIAPQIPRDSADIWSQPQAFAVTQGEEYAEVNWSSMDADGFGWLSNYLDRAFEFGHVIQLEDTPFAQKLRAEAEASPNSEIGRWWARNEGQIMPASSSANMLSDTLDSDAMWAMLPVGGGGSSEFRASADDVSHQRARTLRSAIRRAGRLVPQAHRDDSHVTSGGGARLGLGGQKVAYFCMEYGIESELTIYSGGLGVLAGDIAKANQDQTRDFIAIGLMWDQGYFKQSFNSQDRQIAEDRPTPRHRLRDTGIEISVDIRGKNVPLRALRVLGMGSVELVLLEPINEDDRWMTRRLYSGGHDDRLAQELILGVGGVRALRALGLPIDVYHFNEGHALFAGLELVREGMSTGLSFEDAIDAARTNTVFTTHTPVPAGNETHALQHLWDMGGHLNALSWDQLKAIGGDPFEMTPAALRMSRAANAVAELHGHTARDMWAHIEDGSYIRAITNGVHMPTWQSGAIARLAKFGENDELWAEHQRLKTLLLAEIEKRQSHSLDPNVLLIGFARRAATYKRANLLLRNPQWVDEHFGQKKLQFVFAGKAHPADEGGKDLIQNIRQVAREYPGQLVYLDNYDMHLGALLTRGCDVWLNNPVRPKEASGTSGMKAAANGVLNLSILDGWWDEGCEHGVNGWGVGAPPAGVDADLHDYEALTQLVDEQVCPTYYDNHNDWLDMMRASIISAGRDFSAGRCVSRYYEELYPAHIGMGDVK